MHMKGFASLPGVIPDPVPITWKEAGTHPGSRMITVTRALEEALLQHFIYKKVEIAYAICKPFPFFESLRDKSFITNRMYKECLEACSNLVPISRVVHNILTKLEKTFSVSLLMTLFSQINLHEYPNLEMILQSFKDVGAIYGECSRATPILLEVPTGSAQGCSLQILPPPPPTHPPRVPRGSEPGASLQQREAPSSSDSAVSLPGPMQEGSSAADNITSKMNEEEDPQETPSPAPNTVHVSRDKQTPKMKHEEDPQETPHTPSGPMPGDESLEPNDLEETQKVLITPSNKKGTLSPGHGPQEKLQVVDQVTQRKDSSTCNLKVTIKAQKATTECAQTSRSKEKKREISSWSSPKRKQEKRLQRGETSPGHGIKEKLQVVDEETQRKDDSACNSKIMTRAQKARTECAQISRSKEKPQDDSMDFQYSIPVTCGKVKGILYIEKMKLGASEKFIQNEEGVWLTAKEFEQEGKGRSTRDWKKNVYFRGKSLRKLQEEGCLLCLKQISREW
ncbi:sp110 nuclear body protein isoform X2 [Nycticebus coucang]|uniref:sp110 nuclear body protein isoform X2 n=1 Tax=Nycticebus coucang TaxID=9470 RepID=UPI00234C5EAD|nr:sp110 nuclear body protein isoform X2 [Nycticebus coucang]